MKGELMIRGQRVDLNRLRANLLTVIAEGDHITPPCQSEAVLSKVGSSDKELYHVPGGHIGIMAGAAPTSTLGRRLNPGSQAARTKTWVITADDSAI